MRERTTRKAAWSGVVVLGAVTVMVIVRSASAEAGVEGGGVTVALRVEQSLVERLSQGDARPELRGATGGGADFGWEVANQWWARLGGGFSGSRFRFAGTGVEGAIEEVAWATRVGVDRLGGLGRERWGWVGVGYEYGESRSWLKNAGRKDEGPRNFDSGGYVGIGGCQTIIGRLALAGELRHSVFRGYARNWPAGDRFDWIGQGVAFSLGLVVVVREGNSMGEQRRSGVDD